MCDGNFGIGIAAPDDKLVDNICNDDLFNTIEFTFGINSSGAGWLLLLLPLPPPITNI